MRNLKNLMFNNRGNTLLYVMIAMLVVFIMVAAVASLTQANIRQASAQEKGMQAYYVARSGAELAYDAIITTTPSLLDSFKANPALVLTENDIDFDYGTADVTATSSGTGNGQTILITSVGTMKDDDVSRTVTLQFYIRYDLYPDMIWSK